jgi:hypothetical protein
MPNVTEYKGDIWDWLYSQLVNVSDTELFDLMNLYPQSPSDCANILAARAKVLKEIERKLATIAPKAERPARRK